MLCSEAGDERVSEQGRAVRARTRRLPGRARPPVPRRRARPYANDPGWEGRGDGPNAPARKEAGQGFAHPQGGGGDTPAKRKTRVPAVGFRSAARLPTVESLPKKPQVS